MNRYALWSALGTLLLIGLLASACVRSRSVIDERSSVAGGPLPHRAAMEGEDPLAGLSEAQIEALDLAQGILEGNPLSIPIAQRMALAGQLLTPFNTFYVLSQGQLPQQWSDLVPLLAVWPLTELNEPWPLVPLGDATTYPRGELGPGYGNQPFQLVLTASDWDDSPAHVFLDFMTPAWEAETGSGLLNQPAPFPADLDLSVLGQGLMSAVAFHAAFTRHYPDHPAGAFQQLRVGVSQAAEQALLAAYPRLEFWKASDNSQAALLMEGPGHTRYLCRHSGLAGGDLSVVVWGYTDAGQRMVDRFLQGMELWETYEEALEGIPRITIPLTPSEPE